MQFYVNDYLSLTFTNFSKFLGYQQYDLCDLHSETAYPMEVKAELYRGIEFIRISDLPEDLRHQFWQTFDHKKVIKILRSGSLLNDCVLINDFMHWQQTAHPEKLTSPQSEQATPQPININMPHALVSAQS
ncbi:MAG: hypothetical protein ACKO96_46180 [Flammeovirgaceae bacterium]